MYVFHKLLLVWWKWAYIVGGGDMNWNWNRERQEARQGDTLERWFSTLLDSKHHSENFYSFWLEKK